MIVLDASVLIAYLDDLDEHHRSALDILNRSDSFGVPTLNLAETMVHGVRQGVADDMATAIAGVGIRELERLPRESRSLAVLRVETGLKLPDCCVVACAEAHEAGLATFDDRLARVARGRGLVVMGPS